MNPALQEVIQEVRVKSLSSSKLTLDEKTHSDSVSGDTPGVSLSMWNSKLLARLLSACVLQMLMCCFLYARRVSTTQPPINHKMASITPLVCSFSASFLPSAGFLDSERRWLALPTSLPFLRRAYGYS